MELGEVRKKISDMNLQRRSLFDELKIFLTTTAGLVTRSAAYLQNHKFLVSGCCSTPFNV
jgi:hypothetical protein